MLSSKLVLLPINLGPQEKNEKSKIILAEFSKSCFPQLCKKFCYSLRLVIMGKQQGLYIAIHMYM